MPPSGSRTIEHLVARTGERHREQLTSLVELEELGEYHASPRLINCATYLANHASYLNYPHYLPRVSHCHRGDRRPRAATWSGSLEITGPGGDWKAVKRFLNPSAFISMAISMRTGTSTKARSINASPGQISQMPRLGHPATAPEDDPEDKTGWLGDWKTGWRRRCEKTHQHKLRRLPKP